LIVVPLAGLAEDGTTFWRAAILVANAIFSDAESLARRFRPQMTHLAAIWERRWNEALARATPKSSPLMNGAGSPAVTGPGQIWCRRSARRQAPCRRPKTLPGQKLAERFRRGEAGRRLWQPQTQTGWRYILLSPCRANRRIFSALKMIPRRFFTSEIAGSTVLPNHLGA